MGNRLRPYRVDLLCAVALVLLPLLWFSPVLFTGRTLLPFDNLYTFEPWASMQPGITPHNGLLSDLVLQNTVWKLHIQRSLADGQIPLWNPQIFTGIPFFAGGQSSAAYPLNILFYILPLEAAYGWFTALQLAIAGAGMYIFGRVLRLRPLAALFSGVVFQFSGFLIVSVVFTMVIAAAVWLPLLLAVIERIIQKQEAKGDAAFSPIPYVVAGAIIIGIVALAGHPEFFYYTLLVAGIYSAARLLIAWRRGLGIGDWGLGSGDRGSGTGDQGLGTGELRTTHHAPRTTHHASRTTHHASRWSRYAGQTAARLLDRREATDHAPRTTHHASPGLDTAGNSPSLLDRREATDHASRTTHYASRILKLAAWLLVLALLGIGAGAVQLIPLYELVTLNFREGSATLQQVLGWAWPSRHVLTFAIPNIFGSPSHHHWFDLWNLSWQPATVNALGETTDTIFWGIKNYVEGGSYLGIVTWILAGVAILAAGSRQQRAGTGDRGSGIGDRELGTGNSRTTHHAPRPIPNTQYPIPNHLRSATFLFTGLAVLSLLFAFGTPLYAILFYGLPGWNQLHSPFRWVYPFTLSMAVLGGIGLNLLLAQGMNEELRMKIGRGTVRLRSVVKGLAGLVMAGGAAALGVVAVSYFAPGPFVAFGQGIVDGSDLAQMAFADGRMFWGYQSVNLIHLGLAALAGGALVWWGSGYWGLGIGDWGLGTHAPRTTHHAGLDTPGKEPPGYSTDADGAPRTTHHPGLDTPGKEPPGYSTDADDAPRTTHHTSTGLDTPGKEPPGYSTDADGAPRTTHHAPRILGIVAALLVVIDLFAAHGTFNPATDPALSPLRNVPPVVQFINNREERAHEYPISNTQYLPPFRFTTFDIPGAKTFNANVGMYYGWHDIRGYDSIIPRPYVEKMGRIAEQGELLYNRIAPLYAAGPEPYAVLGNPLLDLFNVKYVLTEHEIPDGLDWALIYDDGTVKVYENLAVFPRAFIVNEAQILPLEAQPVMEADLRRVVFIEEAPADERGLIPASPQVAEARISRYTANDVFVDINLSDRGWLVLADAHFPGWQAYLRPFGGDESDEISLEIQRANGAFRTVYLPEQGQWTVRFVYSPMSFKLGLYISFLAGMAGLLLLLYWLWGRYYRPSASEDEVATVAKNSVVPMGLNLANKAIDFAFAMLYVRLLGPEGTGQYAFVVAVYGFFEIVSRYGLGTLLTRDVAADKSQSSRYLTNVLALRTLLWAVSLPVLAGVTGGYWFTGSIGVQEIQALAIFGAAMLLANWADAFSNLFFAFEKMEYPAGLSSAVALMKVALGAAVLLLGWGFVGLAGVSLVMNVVQLIWLYTLVRSTLFKPQWQWDWGLQKWMLRTSGPLMINHLLATIFWRIDLWILRPLAGAFSVGLYSASLKYLDGLNIIPSTFTFAIFPLMSRYAKKEGEGLLRSYILSSRLLLMVSLPIAMTITVLAEPLIYILGGAEFLNVPDTVTVLGREISYRGGAALALQVIIWSIPIGFVNSVTQFVLIAVNQQGYLTKAFILGVIFNVTGNLIAIPTFDYIGAAVVTILSEFSLLIPFYWSVKRHVGRVPWLDLVWRPVLATGVMGGLMLGMMAGGVDLWLTLIPGWAGYVAVLWLTGGFRGEDMALVGRALPLGRLRRAAA